MPTPLAQDELHQATLAALAAQSEPAYSAGAVPSDAPAAYFVVEVVDADARRTSTSEGASTLLQVRASTRHPKGRATPAAAYAMASRAREAIEGMTLALTSHDIIGPALLPPRVTPNVYDSEAHGHADVMLTYRLLTTQK